MNRLDKYIKKTYSLKYFIGYFEKNHFSLTPDHLDKPRVKGTCQKLHSRFFFVKGGEKGTPLFHQGKIAKIRPILDHENLTRLAGG